MNDSSPLPALSDNKPVDLTLDVSTSATLRWRGNFSSSDAAPAQDFAGEEDGPRADDFLRLWPEESLADRTGRASGWSWAFSLRALQGAVIANGGALIALALLMAAPGSGSKTGLMSSAIMLGLGLMFAAVSAVASLDVRGAQMRLARIAAPLAGAVSYGALAAAFALV